MPVNVSPMVAPARTPSSPRTRARTPAPAAPEEDVRARVLTAAVALIDRVGLAGVSMREVARAAGVSHQAPYHYFADREAIFAALAEDGFKILAERLERVTVLGVPAVDRFVEAGQAYVEFAFDHPALFRIMFRPDMVTMERFPEVKACGDRAFQTVPALVQACIAEGLPADPSVEALVVLAWSIPHGLACLLLDGPLAKKFPDMLAHREELTRDVMRSMRSLLVARSQPTKAAKPAKRPKRRASQ
jgi:AcrR family transcriptional regulator